MAGQAVSARGGVDVLVNNADWSQPGFFTEQTDRSVWQRTIEVTCSGSSPCAG